MKQNVGIMEFHKVALAAAFYMGTCSSDCDCSFGRQSNRRIMASWAKMIQGSCVHLINCMDQKWLQEFIKNYIKNSTSGSG